MITFYQGNSVDMSVNVYRNDSNTVVDLTNAKVWFTIKNSYRDLDTDALLQVTTANGVTIVDPPNGIVAISLTPTLTQTLPTDVSLHCDIQVRTATGKVYTVYIDNLIVNDKVTDALDY